MAEGAVFIATDAPRNRRRDGVGREWVRQMEKKAMEEVREEAGRLGIDREDIL